MSLTSGSGEKPVVHATRAEAPKTEVARVARRRDADGRRRGPRIP